MSVNLQKLFLIRNQTLYIIFIFLITSIKCIPNNEDNNTFYGIYRINTVSRRTTLTNKKDFLYLSNYNYLNNHFRIYLSESKPYYYIELKSNNRKMGVDDKNNIILYKNVNNINLSRVKWNIIKISETEYIFQNKFNKKYLEKRGVHVVCGKDYYKYKKNILFKFTLLKLFEEVEFKKENIEKVEKEPIDLVMKYIDLTDKKLNRSGIIQIQKDEDNEELRYSMRSVLNYIPWVRKIFIILPNEEVRYFKPIKEIKEKIVYIKDKDLMGFESANIYSFIFHFYKLDKFGVSKNFIYMDDDYFIGKELKKSDFFYYDEKEKKIFPCIINFYFTEFNYDYSKKKYKNYFSQKDKINPHSRKGWELSIFNTEHFLFKISNKSHLIYTEFTHNALPMNIDDLKEIFQVIQKYEYVNETLYSIERHILTLLTQYFYVLYNLNFKHRKIHTIEHCYTEIDILKWENLFCPLFVMNTGGDKNYTKNEKKRGMDLVKKRFSIPTKYEIVYKNITTNFKIKNSEKNIKKNLKKNIKNNNNDSNKNNKNDTINSNDIKNNNTTTNNNDTNKNNDINNNVIDKNDSNSENNDINSNNNINDSDSNNNKTENENITTNKINNESIINSDLISNQNKNNIYDIKSNNNSNIKLNLTQDIINNKVDQVYKLYKKKSLSEYFIIILIIIILFILYKESNKNEKRNYQRIINI